MIGLGTLINTAAIVAAGFAGNAFRRLFNDEKQNSLMKALGLTLLAIGTAGSLEGMLSIEGGKIVSGASMIVVLSFAIGTAIGELLDIEMAFEHVGEWLKMKTGNAKDAKFVDAFVSASLAVSIGAMAIVGSIEDGVQGDHTTLAIKALLDFLIISIMCSSLGKGAAFAAIPVFLFEGLMTLGASLIAPLVTETAVHNIAFVGSLLIFALGVNLIWGKVLKVANMLPALVVATVIAYLPFGM